MAMICKKCGKEINDNESKCSNCGNEITKVIKLNKKGIVLLIVIILIIILTISSGFFSSGFFTSGSFTAKGAIKKWAKAILYEDEEAMTNITDVVALEATRESYTEEDFDEIYKELEKELEETTIKKSLKEDYANAFLSMKCNKFDINSISNAKKVEGTKNLYKVKLSATLGFNQKIEEVNCQVILIKKNCKYYVVRALETPLSYYEPPFYQLEDSTTEPSEYEIESFNNQFESYGGSSVTGSQVKSLIAAVETSNAVNSDKEVKLSGTTTNISQVRNSVKYSVEFKYKDKFIVEVIINRIKN